MGSSRQEYWSTLPFPSPGDLLNLGIEPVSLALAGEFFTTEAPGKPTHGVHKALKSNSKWLLKVCSELEEAKKKITKCSETPDGILEQKKDPRGMHKEMKVTSQVHENNKIRQQACLIISALLLEAGILSLTLCQKNAKQLHY